MKKSKKFLLSMCTGALAAVMVMGNSGVVALAESAKAENVEKTYDKVKGIDFNTVEFGDEILVPVTAGYLVNVVDPQGKVLSEGNGLTLDGSNLKVVADKVGHYTVIIYETDENGTKYSYDVLCTSSKEYKLEIEDYKIPSFLKVGSTFKLADLPVAKVYYEEDGEKVYVENADVKVSVSGVDNADNIAEKSATAFVTYTYDVGTGVYVDAQYKILIQDNFEDKVKPSLSVGSYSESANLNIKYTLPTATATDAYDERVQVKITVTDSENKEVLKAVVDEKTGYATGTEDVKVEFDNLDNMSFYPTKKGDYKITYVAVDDAGNESDPLSYVLTVKDQKGPTITVDRSSIPEKWGYEKVYYEDENGDEVEKDDLKIYLPIPEYYDNSDSKLAVALTIKDPAGKQVAKVNNIEKLVNNEAFTADDIDDGDMGTFVAPTTKEGMAVEFDIAGYVDAAIAKIENKDLKSDYKYAGSYTVQYTVTDTVTYSTTSSQTYTINVSENYNDDSTIGITASTEVVKHVVLSEGDTFKLPTFVIASSSDGYLNKTYALKVNGTAMEYTDFVGGEEIKLVKDEAGAYFLEYEGKQLAVNTGDTLVYDISAEADSGREANNAEKSTTIVIPDVQINDYDVVANADLTEITVDLKGADNKYVGVEMGLRSADGEYVDFNATVYYNSIIGKKVIKDIEYITPNEDGTYYLEVRVFDIYGTSQVNVYKLDLKAGTSEDNRESEESAFATSTTVGSSISWKYTTIQTGNEFPKNIVEVIATAHKVSGGRFSWMGSEFTPLQENTYTLIDTVVPLDAAGAVVSGYESVISDKFEMRSEVVASASTAKTVVLDKAMPSYLKNEDASVAAIPSAVIYDATKNYEYTIRITNPNGVVENYSSYDKMLADFKFTSDGKYTVAYLVNGSSVKSYTVKVGDVTPVDFTVVGFETQDTIISKTAPYKFNFAEIKLAEGSTEDETKLTVKKSIRDAAGNLVGKEYEKTGSNGMKEKGETVTLTETGTYTVTYTVIDQSGNESYKKITIKITSSTKAQDIDYTVLSTVIIIVVCLGIAGIIIYYVASGRKKNKKNNK